MMLAREKKDARVESEGSGPCRPSASVGLWATALDVHHHRINDKSLTLSHYYGIHALHPGSP